MNKEQLLKIVEDLSELYNPNRISQNHLPQNDIKPELTDNEIDDEFDDDYDYVEGLIEASSFIEEPLDRIDYIISEIWFEIAIDDEMKAIDDDLLPEEEEFGLDEVDLANILSLLPSGKSKKYLSTILPQQEGIENPSKELGIIFKECGESIEALPVEILSNSDFLLEYIITDISENPEIKNMEILNIPETRGSLIERTKREYRTISLKEISQHNMEKNI